MTSYDLYTKTPPGRLFFMVAVPGAISMAASSLWGLFDGIFVGQFLGDTAFAALNLAFPFVMINFSLADLVGVGAAVPISISLGRGDQRSANNYFTCSCILIVLTSLLMGVVMYLGAPTLMQLVGAEGELAQLGVTYVRVYALCSPFTTIIFAVDNFLRISGQIKGSMALNIAMSLLILALEFLFFQVLNFGIAGSALGVSLGMMLCSAVAFVPFAQGKLVLRFCKPQLSWDMLRRIVVNGTPNFLNTTAERLTGILMNAALMMLGGTMAVNIYGVLTYAGFILLQLLYGTCDALQPAIGYNWGANQPRRVWTILRYCLSSSAILCLAGTAVMLLAPKPIITLFLTHPDAETLEYACFALRLFSLTYLTRWIGFALQSFFLAIEKPLFATLVSLGNAMVVPLVLMAALWPLGLTGLWLNSPLTSAVIAVLALLLLDRLRRSVAKEPNAPASEQTA